MILRYDDDDRVWLDLTIPMPDAGTIFACSYASYSRDPATIIKIVVRDASLEVATRSQTKWNYDLGYVRFDNDRSLVELASASTTVEAPVALQVVVSRDFGYTGHWRKRPLWPWTVHCARDSIRSYNPGTAGCILLCILHMCVGRQCSPGVRPITCQICDCAV